MSSARLGTRPIIFTGPMVRALLEGRKTQTRRLLDAEVPPRPSMTDIRHRTAELRNAPYLDAYCGGARKTDKNPRGASQYWCWWTRDNRAGKQFRVPYVAGDILWVKETHALATGVLYEATDKMPLGVKRRPSIYMPRWASRLTLVVTEVRVQKLHDIGMEDALAEGVDNPAVFAELWEQIHGEGAWNPNPWVVALSFAVHRVNVDRMQAEAA